MFKRKITVLVIFILSASLLAASGCSSAEADREYIDFAEDAAEEYLVAANNRDFPAFSAHLSKEMEAALPEAEFLKFAGQMEAMIGKYIEGSKEFVKLEKKSGYIIIVYDTEYTDEPAGVEFRLTLQKVEGEIKIAGSWFNSPKLRGE